MAYYASNFYGSNYYASQYYGGEAAPVVANTYFERLGALGFAGSTNDREYAYLQSLGFTGAKQDCKKQHLENLGYTGAIPDMLRQKAAAESHDSFNKMMKTYGLIPVGG